MRNLFIKSMILTIVIQVYSPLCFSLTRSKNRKIAQESIMQIDDVVYKTEPSDSNYRVLFRSHSGVYYLRNNSKNYDQILHLLNLSKSNQEKIKVQVDANTMEIKEIAVQIKP